MKKFIAFLMVGAFLLGSTLTASAFDVKLDVGSQGYGTGDGMTGLFDQMQFYSQTTTTQFGTIDPLTLAPSVGSAFSDIGSFQVTAFLNPGAIGDTEGINTNYELTGSWSGLTGTIISQLGGGGVSVQTTAYNPGTIIDLYIDDVDHNFGASIGAEDDANFNDGFLVGQITLTGGYGSNTFINGVFTSGSSAIQGEFTSLANDFWYDQFGDDMYEKFFLEIGWEITADIDQNVDAIEIIAAGAGDNHLFKINSTHDGSIDVGVVPEPATLALFGLGLLSIAGVARRKS